MAARRGGDVFLNIPFARSHEFVYLALITGLVGLGLKPRCVLEIPPQHDRLRRLFDLIGSCAYSIHDLSFVKLSSGAGPRVPRFNMAFELGLAVAIALARKEGTQHQFRMLEAQPYRMQKSLSDMLGFDPYIHNGRADGVLEALLNVFSTVPNSPELTDLRRSHRQLRRYRNDALGHDIFTAKPFAQLVVTARTLVQ